MGTRLQGTLGDNAVTRKDVKFTSLVDADTRYDASYIGAYEDITLVGFAGAAQELHSLSDIHPRGYFALKKDDICPCGCPEFQRKYVNLSSVDLLMRRWQMLQETDKTYSAIVKSALIPLEPSVTRAVLPFSSKRKVR